MSPQTIARSVDTQYKLRPIQGLSSDFVLRLQLLEPDPANPRILRLIGELLEAQPNNGVDHTEYRKDNTLLIFTKTRWCANKKDRKSYLGLARTQLEPFIGQAVEWYQGSDQELTTRRKPNKADVQWMLRQIDKPRQRVEVDRAPAHVADPRVIQRKQFMKQSLQDRRHLRKAKRDRANARHDAVNTHNRFIDRLPSGRAPVGNSSGSFPITA